MKKAKRILAILFFLILIVCFVLILAILLGSVLKAILTFGGVVLFAVALDTAIEWLVAEE